VVENQQTLHQTDITWRSTATRQSRRVSAVLNL